MFGLSELIGGAVGGSVLSSMGSSALSLGGDLAMWEGQKDFARENRRYQARREDSAVQRRVADLMAAGLNPMLAYNSAAASSASAAQPSGFSPSESLARRQAADLANAQAAKVRAETGLIDTQKANIEADTFLKTNSAVEAQARTSVANETVRKLQAEVPLIRTEHDLKKVEVELAKLSETEKRLAMPSVLLHLAASAQLENLKIPEARAFARKFETWVGEHVVPWLGEVKTVGHTAAGIAAPFAIRFGLSAGRGVPGRVLVQGTTPNKWEWSGK